MARSVTPSSSPWLKWCLVMAETNCHPNLYQRGIIMRIYTKRLPIHRFMEKIEVQRNGCWYWTASRNQKGYGLFGDEDRKCKSAHRWLWQKMFGPVPLGMQLDHFKCDTPQCVQPYHVRPVSPRENTLRGNGLTAVHAAKTHCINGHEFSEENTGQQQKGRRCKTCKREADSRHWRKKSLRPER